MALASVMRVTCVVGKSMLMPVKVLEAIGGFARVRNLLAEDQVIGVLVRKAGYSIRLSPPRHRERQPPPRVQLVPQPALAVVQDPPPDGLPHLPGRAGGEPGGRRPGLGLLGRLGHRLGRAGRPGRPGHGARRLADALAVGTVPRAPALLFSPVKDILLLPLWFDAMVNRASSGAATASASAG